MKNLKEITIHIYENSEDDINYAIYESPEDIENLEDEIDGGICTGSFEDALEMAKDQAVELIKRNKKEKPQEMNQNEKIEVIEALLKDLNILVACDEEWNALYGKFEIGIDEETNRPVIYGLSGSEIDQ